MENFRDGSAKILVATDIAARGIDVSQISHVINFDMPDSTDAYTHRIGRTGRVEKTGEAFTFITRKDTAMVCDLERLLDKKIERRTLPGFDYTKPAPQRPVMRPPFPAFQRHLRVSAPSTYSCSNIKR
jgi:ATP-dependent RNA helicase RhlE